ncbi:MAG: hypothetical protein WBF08_02845 [Candidatus Bathyarchaeia archaeon]
MELYKKAEVRFDTTNITNKFINVLEKIVKRSDFYRKEYDKKALGITKPFFPNSFRIIRTKLFALLLLILLIGILSTYFMTPNI